MRLVRRIVKLMTFTAPAPERGPGAGQNKGAGGQQGGTAGGGSSRQKPGASFAPDEVLRQKLPLLRALEDNAGVLRRVFRVPQNKDLVMREFTLNTNPP
ncbi:MAG TPA: hypothetical protein DCL13_02935, partial [Peptococcaceae bacterium]|nr:hypothetical protein [Peptococcaceae bacterium]